MILQPPIIFLKLFSTTMIKYLRSLIETWLLSPFNYYHILRLKHENNELTRKKLTYSNSDYHLQIIENQYLYHLHDLSIM